MEEEEESKRCTNQSFPRICEPDSQSPFYTNRRGKVATTLLLPQCDAMFKYRCMKWKRLSTKIGG